MKQTKFVLQEKDMPSQWYNIMADMPNLPAPPLLFSLSGHGNFDMQAYADYLGRKLKDAPYPAEKIKEALSRLPEYRADKLSAKIL